eukprot:TRINITY_DN21469_c0_g2_i1.p1 TRINITY_DN21469_c0_g2~~TRINITY_DN21469_c0_g2_i1.p1  ORF type:complete len:352 (+),score=52.01 TRINITY_DN21469_c0_g2_i1:320-1375(+)
MAASSGNRFVELMTEKLRALETPSADIHKTLQILTLLCNLVFLLFSLILNFTIIINILYTRKTSVAYFRLLILYCLFHVVFQAVDLYLDIHQPIKELLEPGTATEPLTWLEENAPVLRRGLLGILFLLVATLTIERFLFSSVRGLANYCLQFVTCILALTLPALLAAFQIVSKQVTMFQQSPEVWFGIEIGVYIILPLLILTIFGTVNYCKVSLSSRLIPTFEVAGIKVNIGLVVLSNISIFIFLIQECLLLWIEQLSTRDDGDQQAVKDMLQLVTVSMLCTRLGLNLIQWLVPVLILILFCSCSRPCCCSSINQLEETRYKPISRAGDDTMDSGHFAVMHDPTEMRLKSN